MKILSIDQSTAKSGYAVFRGSDLLEWDTVDLHKDKVMKIRFEKMCLELDSLIKKHKPDIVVFEDVSLRTSIKTLIDLARLQGSIIQTCYLNKIDFLLYPATRWRRIIGINQSGKIKREALKEQAINMIKESYGIDVDDDCAEAICIGLAYIKENIFSEEGKESINGIQSK